MSKKQDRAINDSFSRLNKKQQTLIILDFEGNHSNKEIAPKIGLKNETTVSHWRKRPWYDPAFNAYASRAIKGKYKSMALRTLIDLLDARSEMVKLQAATSILKLSGMLSDNSTPELDQARIRKANAEADIAEQKVKLLKNDNTGITKIVFSDDLKPDKEDDSKQKGSEDDGANAKPK